MNVTMFLNECDNALEWVWKRSWMSVTTLLNESGNTPEWVWQDKLATRLIWVSHSDFSSLVILLPSPYLPRYLRGYSHSINLYSQNAWKVSHKSLMSNICIMMWKTNNASHKKVRECFPFVQSNLIDSKLIKAFHFRIVD